MVEPDAGFLFGEKGRGMRLRGVIFSKRIW